MTTIRKILATLMIGGGIATGLVVATPSVASAEPSPGIHRATYHCHLYWGPLAPWSYCHAGND